ncbi:MAG: D-Ala-D-Ala carboxypeptidase family metallohydrolase [Bacteriovoracia bacterium]
MVKAHLQKQPSCFFTIGYRSCKTNSGIRGAARRSRHLCGKAADVRKGTCSLGQVHTKGSAVHQHFSPLGPCQ